MSEENLKEALRLSEANAARLRKALETVQIDLAGILGLTGSADNTIVSALRRAEFVARSALASAPPPADETASLRAQVERLTNALRIAEGVVGGPRPTAADLAKTHGIVSAALAPPAAPEPHPFNPEHVVEGGIHDPVKCPACAPKPEEPDFLDEVMADRTAQNPAFPAMVAEAGKRRAPKPHTHSSVEERNNCLDCRMPVPPKPEEADCEGCGLQRDRCDGCEPLAPKLDAEAKCGALCTDGLGANDGLPCVRLKEHGNVHVDANDDWWENDEWKPTRDLRAELDKAKADRDLLNRVRCSLIDERDALQADLARVTVAYDEQKSAVARLNIERDAIAKKVLERCVLEVSAMDTLNGSESEARSRAIRLLRATDLTTLEKP